MFGSATDGPTADIAIAANAAVITTFFTIFLLMDAAWTVITYALTGFPCHVQGAENAQKMTLAALPRNFGVRQYNADERSYKA